MKKLSIAEKTQLKKQLLRTAIIAMDALNDLQINCELIDEDDLAEEITRMMMQLDSDIINK